MQTDVSNVLSDLITLSDNADQLISDTNVCNDEVGQWFSIIKQTAIQIVQGKYTRASTGTEKTSCFSDDDLPSIVTLVKGKQNSHRVSALLAVQRENRVRLSHRKSRKSLRKIVLGKKSGNQWKISDRKSSVKSVEINFEDEITPSTPKVEDKLLNSEFRTPVDISTIKNHLSKSYFAGLDSSSKIQVDSSTPIQSKEILAPNTDETTPVTRSKLKANVGSTKVVKINKKTALSSILPETKTSVDDNKISNASQKPPSTNNSVVSKESSDSQGRAFQTPGNETITIDSDGSANKNDYTSPLTRSKRKSSVQLTQENAKRIKKTTSASQMPCSKQKNLKRDDNLNAFKQIKVVKDINPVIPAKNIQPQSQPCPEKRILREIQKKEEKVTQNAQKLQSLKKQKIEESKKARERKMEKARQLRMKMEKDKEERNRSRTQSRQENVQQSEPPPKKAALKRVESIPSVKKPSKSQPEEKFEPPQKPLRSPLKKVRISPFEKKSPINVAEINKTYLHDPSPKEMTNAKNSRDLNATYVRSPATVAINSTPTSEKAPPKPLRSALKQKEISNDSKETGKPGISAYSSNNSSTPVAKKVESKVNLAKTPVMKNAKKSNSYAMTPHEKSLVSYDISEIKSDSDDEDEEVHNKPIPTWASGVHLRSALLNQHYAPINVSELFGNYFPPPNLQKIMGIEKKQYHKRTSSAIWLESPNRSRTYYT